MLRPALVLFLFAVVAAAQPHRETVLAWSSSHSKYSSLRGFRHWPSLPLFAADVTAAEKRSLAADPSIQLLATQQLYRTDTNPGLPAAAFPTVWQRGYTGVAAPVAIVDTGVWSGHPEFQNLRVEGSVFLEAGKKHACFDDDATNPRDLQGHGTRTASILFSAAPGLQRLYSLKAGFKPKSATPGCPASDGILLSTDIFDALDYAVRNTPAKVINLSLGAPAQSDDDLMAKVMDYVVETYGVTLVFSAGNSGADATINSPGISYNGITVANLDEQGNVHFSSTRGPTPGLRRKPDLAAVGVSITAADAFSSGTTIATGTSAAAPLVSAAAALLREAGVDDALTVKALLLNSTGQTPPWRSDSGWGPLRLDTAFPARFQTLTAQGPRYFSAVFQQPARGTLVWNRSVNTNAPDGPSPLRPVTLIAYQRGVELARTGPEANGNVLRLDLPAGDYILQVDTTSETYAMAWDQPGITNVTAPSITMSCAYPGTVTAAQPVQISCTASNTGGLPLSNVTGTLLAPLGFGSGGPQSFGNLAPGASRTIFWTVNAATSPGNYTLSANVTASGFGANLTADASPMPPLQVTSAANAPALHPLASTGAPVEIRNAGTQPWTVRSAPASVQVTVTGTSITFAATASATGTYTVSNGAATLTGTVAIRMAQPPAPQVEAARLAVEPSMTAGCPLPEAISIVSEAALPAVWFESRKVSRNDRALVRWLRPNGTVALQSTLAMPDEDGAICFSATAPSLLNATGMWTAEIYWNGVKQQEVVRFEVRQRMFLIRDPAQASSLRPRFITLGQPDSTRFVYIEPGGARLHEVPQAPLAGDWSVEVYLDHALSDTVPVTISAPVSIPYAEIKDNTLYFESDRELEAQFVTPSGKIALQTRSGTGIVPLPESDEQGLWQARLIANDVTVRVIPFARLPFPIYSAMMDREQYSSLDASAKLHTESEQPLQAVYVHEASDRQVKKDSLPIAGGTGARYTGKWEARAVNADGIIFAKVPFTITGPGVLPAGTAWAPLQPWPLE